MSVQKQGDLETLDLKITRAWAQLLKAKDEDIDKRMARVDALLDQRLLLTKITAKKK